MNYLESYYFRKDELNKIFSQVPFETDRDREMTIGAWNNSNLTLEQIKFLLNNADKKEIEGIKNKKDLRIAMAIEEEQLREGKGKEKKSNFNFNYNFDQKENFNFKGVDW